MAPSHETACHTSKRPAQRRHWTRWADLAAIPRSWRAARVCARIATPLAIDVSRPSRILRTAV